MSTKRFPLSREMRVSRKGKYKPSRNLRSGTEYLLTVPRTNTKTYGDRSFQVAAAKLFNKLPMELKTAVCTIPFKAQLKTYLFNLWTLLYPFVYKYFVYKHSAYSCIFLHSEITCNFSKCKFVIFLLTIETQCNGILYYYHFVVLRFL